MPYTQKKKKNMKKVHTIESNLLSTTYKMKQPTTDKNTKTLKNSKVYINSMYLCQTMKMCKKLPNNPYKPRYESNRD